MVLGLGRSTPTAAPDVDASVLKSSRSACWAARDAWVACADSAGAPPPTPAQLAAGEKAAVPPTCAAKRAAFEAACSKSWVRGGDGRRVRRRAAEREIDRRAAPDISLISLSLSLVSLSLTLLARSSSQPFASVSPFSHSSQVHHFDALRVKEAEYYRRVQAGIAAAAARKQAAGSLAGEAQGGKAQKAAKA